MKPCALRIEEDGTAEAAFCLTDLAGSLGLSKQTVGKRVNRERIDVFRSADVADVQCGGRLFVTLGDIVTHELDDISTYRRRANR